MILQDYSKAEVLSILLDSFPARVVVKDLDGRYVYLNQPAQEKKCGSEKNKYQDQAPPELSFSSRTDNTAGNAAPRGTLHFPLRDPMDGTILGTCTCEFNATNHGEDSTSSTWSSESVHLYPFLDDDDSNDEEKNLACNATNSKRARSAPLTEPVGAGDAAASVDEKECIYKEVQEQSHLEQQQQDTSRLDMNRDDLYNNLLENIQTAICIGEVITDEVTGEPLDFIYCVVNPAFEQYVGIDASECVGKCFTEVFPGIESDSTNWIKLFGNVALSGVTEKFTQYSEKLETWFSGVAYQTDAKYKRFAVNFMDVSETMESRQALQESEERHRNLFETMIQGVVYQEACGNIMAANPAAERILGLTVDQMMGRTSVDPRWKSIREDGSIFPGEEHPSMLALKTGKPVTNVTMGVFHPQYGENHWIKIDAVPRFRPGEDKPYQVYATFTDITETKRFEYKLMRAKEKAEEADKLKSAFLANVSHEIRTPLNGIIGHIDLALSNDLSEEWRTENLEGLQIAKTSGTLLISIIQDILDLSKIEAGQMEVNDDEPFSIAATMNQTARLADAIIKSRQNPNIRFSCSLDSTMKDTVLGDPFRLQQVVNNLVSNAIKFTKKGKVELRVKLLDNATLEFSVLDTGKGIPASHIETIFEPFRQVEISDTREHGGTGLGLTISRKLVKMMGGKLRVESSVLGPIQGSLFAFTLPYKPIENSPQLRLSPSSFSDFMPAPVSPPQSVDESHNATIGSLTAVAAAIESGNCHNHDTSRFHILVAEDDPVSRKLVSRMLQRSGYDVLLASDGEEAVSMFLANKDVQLVLMDVQMPKLSGHEATERIRIHEKESNGNTSLGVPIIALSAGAMKGDLEKGLSFGMTDYLTKPVDYRSLVQTLEKYLGSNH